MLPVLGYTEPKDVPILVNAVLPMTSSLLPTPGWSVLVYQPHPDQKVAVDFSPRPLQMLWFQPKTAIQTTGLCIHRLQNSWPEGRILPFCPVGKASRYYTQGNINYNQMTKFVYSQLLGALEDKQNSHIPLWSKGYWWQDRASTAQLYIKLVQMPWHCPYSQSVSHCTY